MTEEEKARLDLLANWRYDLDRYQHIIDVVKSRKEHDETPLLDSTEIDYVMKQLADARSTIAYYRKRNSDPSGRW